LRLTIVVVQVGAVKIYVSECLEKWNASRVSKNENDLPSHISLLCEQKYLN
jgi:hypothetical protein